MKTAPPKYGHGTGSIIGPDNFYNPKIFTNIKYSGNLPHWHQQGVMQFITFRLGDSLPQDKLLEIKQAVEEWKENHAADLTPEEYDEYCNLYDFKFEEYLNNGFGECLLRYEPIQDIVESAIRHYDGVRYELFDFIIMPNHVHLLLIPGTEFMPQEIINSIKSYSARRINKLLGREGKIWQKESFDRMIRSYGDYESKKEYIKHNGDHLM